MLNTQAGFWDDDALWETAWIVKPEEWWRMAKKLHKSSVLTNVGIRYSRFRDNVLSSFE